MLRAIRVLDGVGPDRDEVPLQVGERFVVRIRLLAHRLRAVALVVPEVDEDEPAVPFGLAAGLSEEGSTRNDRGGTDGLFCLTCLTFRQAPAFLAV